MISFNLDYTRQDIRSKIPGPGTTITNLFTNHSPLPATRACHDTIIWQGDGETGKQADRVLRCHFSFALELIDTHPDPNQDKVRDWSDTLSQIWKAQGPPQRWFNAWVMGSPPTCVPTRPVLILGPGCARLSIPGISIQLAALRMHITHQSRLNVVMLSTG